VGPFNSIACVLLIKGFRLWTEPHQYNQKRYTMKLTTHLVLIDRRNVTQRDPFYKTSGPVVLSII